MRAYTQTTGAWVRAILQTEYGVGPKAVTWVTQTGAHVPEYQELPDVVRVPKDRSLLDMLKSGEIDAAIFGNDLPDEPWLLPVIPNPDRAAASAFLTNGTVAINHVLCVTEDAVSDAPQLPARLTALFRAAKAALPARQGPDLFPQGLDAMRPSLEVLVSTVFDQGLVPRSLSVDELFPA